jgi:progressive ankylosis protein
MTITTPAPGTRHYRKIFATWWPLAASWILMSLELPALSAVIARLPNPDINLAAYGGVVFPMALIFESPIIMLLAASTALSKDCASYQRLQTYMMRAGLILTAVHILVAFTPLYYLVVVGMIGAPQEIVEPARLGLMIMTPWSWSIAYRRFNQGVLIRSGHSKSVGLGTVVRLSANLIVLTIGYIVGNIPGIVVGTSAVACGVISEAIYAGLVVRPVLHNELRLEPAVEPPLNWQVFGAFYFPLVMTSLLSLLANPIGSAALSRMPLALESLAVWSVITGLIFILRSLGIAYNEVVVTLLDECGAYPYLKRFAYLLAGTTTFLLLVVTATPVSQLWFQVISALRPELAKLAQGALWFALPLPALSVLQSWYQGAILYGKRTNGITESVVIYLVTSLAVLGTGVAVGTITGLNIGILALTLSVATQTGWLWHRSREVRQTLDKRDQEMKTV